MREERKTIDLTGKKFGNLSVIGQTGQRRENGIVWILRNEDTQEIVEATTRELNANLISGFKGSKKQREIAKTTFSEEVYLKTRISKYEKSKGGISFRKDRGMWTAYIGSRTNRKFLGTFSTEDEAKAARKKAVDEQIKILKNQLEKDD